MKGDPGFCIRYMKLTMAEVDSDSPYSSLLNSVQIPTIFIQLNNRHESTNRSKKFLYRV